MNKKQLTQAMAKKLALSEATTKPVLDEILQQLHRALAEGEKVYLPQFGTFELRYYLPKTGRNPRTGETIEIEGYNQPSFKPSPALKDAVNP
ncbi:HU family DNA-binding protein [Shewanella submarina]|nr:HU family DNA-binding protein [Shewanella submarina]MCL1039140.1 HU family DNA-binding protein [Shewanella submarina]